MSRRKNFLNSIWKEFIYGGHLLSLGASSIAFTSAILLNIPVTWDFLLIVYLIFYVIYSYNRFKEFESDFLTNPSRTRHIEKYIKYFPLIISCSFLVVILLLVYFGNFQSLVLGFLMIASGLLYTEYFKKVTSKIIGFKNFYVSFVWASLLIFILFYYNFLITINLFPLFLFIFLRIITNNIFFDIKDINSDKEYGLKTIPIFYGRKIILKYLHVINAISFLPLLVIIYKNVLPLFSLSLIIFYFYSFYYLQRAKNEKTNIQNLSYVIADGEYLFWPVVLLVTKYIIIGQ